MIKTLRLIPIVLSTSVLASLSAVAAPATYIFTGEIVGTLDGQSVAGALTLTVTGDTANVVDNGHLAQLTVGVVSTFELAGFSPFTVTVDSYVFDNRLFGKIGFGAQKAPPCCDIIQHELPVYGSYDLLSSLGPVDAVSNLSLGSWVDLPTSAGLFTVTTMDNNTFQAIVDSAPTVPEPGMLALLALAGVGAARASKRRHRAAPPMR